MAANASSTAVPISVPPSQQWDGNDGPWSSFNVHIGTPAQVARVLVASALGETWVISENSTQGGCLSTDPSTCPNSRGGLINVNESSTWRDEGIYALGIEKNLQDYLDPYGNGDYGFDTLGVGQPGSGGVQLEGMVISALATKEYYLGNLGVNQQPTNFSTFSDPKPSFLKSLKTSGKIPSLSWAYTAGNQYRAKKVFGSLTLGGTDSARYIPNTNTFGFAGDISRDLVVGLQSITYSDNTTTNKVLMDSGILSFVDSTVPHIWLPISACQAFEKAFGLEYNTNVSRYLVNDTQHTAMLAQNASVSFVLGNEINGGSTVNITLPYGAFDLITGSPIVPNNTRYFPIRQAANDTQYTLGRTFLQEAYLTVDYERSNFSISQATFSNTQPSLAAIEPAASSNPATPPGATIITPPPSHSLPVGAIVGIVIAAIILLAAGAIGAFFYIRYRRRSRSGSQQIAEDADPLDKPEMDGQSKQIPIELFGPDGSKNSSLKNPPDSEIEMEGSKAALDAKLAAEMEGSKSERHEMAAAGTGPAILTGRLAAEMEGEGDVPQPLEMYAGPHGLYELDSPLVAPSDGPPTGATRSSNGLPTPSSASGLRTSDGGAPSPISPTSDSRAGSVSGAAGRRISWGRRSKAVPRLPSEAEDTSGISSQDERGSSSSTHHIWSPRRSSRPSASGTASKPPTSPPQPQSQSKTVTPRTATQESTRDRHRRGADALTARLESSTSLASSTSAYATPRESGSPRPAPDRFDSWNQRFGSSSPQKKQQQHLRESEQSAISGIGSSSSGGRTRRPSEQSTSGLMSPISPAEERVPSPRIPSPRVPSAAVSGTASPLPRIPGAISEGPSAMGSARSSPRRSPRPPDPPTGGAGGGGFF